MTVVFADATEADLEAIGDFIARDNPVRALSFIAELRAACLDLSNMPSGYQLVPRYEHPGVRRKPFRNYLIFYRVAADTIEILHILHGARDYEGLLFPDD